MGISLISIPLAWALIFVQLFGGLQGGNPLNLSKWISELEISDWFFPNAYAASDILNELHLDNYDEIKGWKYHTNSRLFKKEGHVYRIYNFNIHLIDDDICQIKLGIELELDESEIRNEKIQASGFYCNENQFNPFTYEEMNKLLPEIKKLSLNKWSMDFIIPWETSQLPGGGFIGEQSIRGTELLRRPQNTLIIDSQEKYIYLYKDWLTKNISTQDPTPTLTPTPEPEVSLEPTLNPPTDTTIVSDESSDEEELEVLDETELESEAPIPVENFEVYTGSKPNRGLGFAASVAAVDAANNLPPGSTVFDVGADKQVPEQKGVKSNAGSSVRRVITVANHTEEFKEGDIVASHVIQRYSADASVVIAEDQLIQRKYLDSTSAARFLEVVKTAYDDAVRFIVGTSTISSVNYSEQDLGFSQSEGGPTNRFIKEVNEDISELAGQPYLKLWFKDQGGGDSQAQYDALKKYFYTDYHRSLSKVIYSYNPADSYDIFNMVGQQAHICNIVPNDNGVQDNGLFIVFGDNDRLEDISPCEDFSMNNENDHSETRGDVFKLDQEALRSCVSYVSNGESKEISNGNCESSLTVTSVDSDGGLKRIGEVACSSSIPYGCDVISFTNQSIGDSGNLEPVTDVRYKNVVLKNKCIEADNPYVVVYPGQAFSAQSKHFPEGHDYFFWLQLQFNEKDQSCGYSGQKPEYGSTFSSLQSFRVLGFSKNKIDNIFPFDLRMTLWNEFGVEPNIVTHLLNLTSDNIRASNESAPLISGIELSESKIQHLNNLEDQGRLRFLGQAKPLMDNWFQTDFRLYELLLTAHKVSGMSLKNGYRGIIPISLSGNTSLGQQYESYTPKYVLDDEQKGFKPVWGRSLFEGPRYTTSTLTESASEYDKTYFSKAGLGRLFVYGPSLFLGTTSSLEASGDSFWTHGLPFVGSWIEFSSLAALNSVKGKSYFQKPNTEDHAIRKSHVLGMRSLIPGFRIYQGDLGNGLKSIEIALRDVKKMDSESKEDAFITLGLIPQKNDSIVIEPINLAQRGMSQAWRRTRPVGFPMGDNNMESDLSTLVVEGEAVIGSITLDNLAVDHDIAQKWVKAYKDTADLYATKRSEEKQFSEMPLAVSGDAKDYINSVENRKTFMENLIGFESDLYKGLFPSPVESEDGTDGANPNLVSSALTSMSKAISDGDNIWLLYLERPHGVNASNEEFMDPRIKHKLFITKISKDNPLALKDMIQSDPRKPFPLFIPPLYAPMLELTLKALYGSPAVENIPILPSGYYLNYHDVLWVHPNRDGGEAITGADLVAISLRFSFLLMYLMTFACLNEKNFNDMIKGFHDVFGGEEAYQGLIGKAPPKADDKEESPTDKIVSAFARMVHGIEKNKAAIMDQCWATPFMPLRAFKFQNSNVNKVGKELIEMLGLAPSEYKHFKEIKSGIEVELIAKDKKSAPSDPQDGKPEVLNNSPPLAGWLGDKSGGNSIALSKTSTKEDSFGFFADLLKITLVMSIIALIVVKNKGGIKRGFDKARGKEKPSPKPVPISTPIRTHQTI
jgi:hypothetical protein